jgi:starvation-inducible DNA-binding protein
MNIIDKETKMYQTKTGIDQKNRKQINNLLQKRLADSIDLSAQIKNAHWNVKGPSFIALHELFDKVWEQSLEYSDLIAERIAQFGGEVDGTIQTAAKDTNLDKYPLNSRDGYHHVEALAHTLATYGELVRKAIDQCNDLKDAGTTDIFTEITRSVDKNLWFVEAHLQAAK